MITIICNCFCGEAHRVSNIELEFGNVDDAILIMKSLLLINMKQQGIATALMSSHGRSIGTEVSKSFSHVVKGSPYRGKLS